MPLSIAILMAAILFDIAVIEACLIDQLDFVIADFIIVGGPSLVAAGGALLGRRMGNSPMYGSRRLYFEGIRPDGKQTRTPGPETVKGEAFSSTPANSDKTV